MAASTRSLNRSLAALGAVALVSVGVLTLGSTPAYAADQTFEVTEPVTSLPPQPGELGWAIEQCDSRQRHDRHSDKRHSARQQSSHYHRRCHDTRQWGHDRWLLLVLLCLRDHRRFGRD